MPQASDALRAEMQRRFGDPIDDSGPIRFLRQRGWTLNDDWTWFKPGSSLGSMPRDEFECVLFLMHEWDFGGVGDGVGRAPRPTVADSEESREEP